MTSAYCSTCGSALGPDAHFCGRCGASAIAPQGAAWSGAETTYVPGNTEGAPAGYATYPDPSWSGPVALPPTAPPSRRRPSATLLLAAGAVVLAVAAAAVALLLGPGGGSAQHAATSSSSVTSRTDAVAGSPQSTDRITSASASNRPVPPGSGGQDAVPHTTTGLRTAYDSGTPVDSGAYAQGSAIAFETPSHNIECVVTTESPVGLTCAIGVYDFSQPGPDCNNGAVLTINGYGNATYSGCLPSAFAPGSSTLAYGRSVSAGEFGCVSRSVGVTCLDLATNTGFTLSRQQFVPVN